MASFRHFISFSSKRNPLEPTNNDWTRDVSAARVRHFPTYRLFTCSVCLSICLSICLSVSLYDCVCLCVCLSVPVVGRWSVLQVDWCRPLVPVNRRRQIRLTHHVIGQCVRAHPSLEPLTPGHVPNRTHLEHIPALSHSHPAMYPTEPT